MVDQGFYDAKTRDRIRALFEAYLEGTFCMVNPLGSTMMQDKGLLGLARDLYPELEQTIPETHIVDKSLTERKGLTKRIQKGRDFVLKGRRSYSGKACILRPSEVSKKFEEICGQIPGKWIAQKRIEIAQAAFSSWDQGEIRIGSFPFVVGSFGRSAYLRVGARGSDAPINADQGSSAAPLLVIQTE